MNIRIDYYDEQEISHSDKNPQHTKPARPSAVRRSSTARRGKSPAQVNGIHRRRRKRISW